MADPSLQYIIEILMQDAPAAEKLQKLGLTLDEIRRKAKDVNGALSEEGASLDVLEQKVQEASDRIRKAYAWIPETTDAVSRQIGAIKRLEMQLYSLAQQGQTASSRYKALEKALQQANLTLIETAADTDDALSGYKGLSEAYMAQEQTVNELLKAEQLLDAAIREVTATEEQETEQTDDSSKKHVTLRQQLYNVRMEMARLVEEGKFGTQAYKELAENAQELQKEQALVNLSMQKGVGLKAFVGTLQLVNGAVSTGIGVMQMLGLSTEDAAKAERRFQSVMSVAVGLQQLSNALKQEGIVMQGIYITQKKAEAVAQSLANAAIGRGVVATKALTLAQKLFNAVAAMNPYVLLAMAILSVVGAIAGLIAATRNNTEAQERQQKAVEKINRAMDKEKEQIRQLRRAHSQETDMLRAKGAAASEVHAATMRQIRDEISAVGKEIMAYKALILAEKSRLIAEGQLREENGKLVGRKEIVERYNTMVKELHTMGEEYADMWHKLRVEEAQWATQLQDLQQEVTDAIRKAQEERIGIMDAYYGTARKKAADAYRKELSDIAREEQDWQKKHPGLANASFAERRENARLRLQLDTEQAEDEFRRWKQDFEKNTAQLTANVRVDLLRAELEVETDITRQQAIRARLQEAETAARKEQLTLEMNTLLESRYQRAGAQAVGAYAAAATPEAKAAALADARKAGLTLADVQEGVGIIQSYYDRLQATISELRKSFVTDALQQSSDRLLSYLEAETEAISWRNEQMRKLAAGESGLSAEDIAKLYDSRMAAAAESFGMPEEDQQAIVESLRLLMDGIVSTSFDVIQEKYDAFAADLTARIGQNADEVRLLSAAGATAGPDGTLLGLTGEAVTPEEQQQALVDLASEYNIILGDTESTWTRIMELLTENGVLQKTLNDAQQKAFAAQAGAYSESVRKQQKMRTDALAAANALKIVSGAAKSVASAFGGALSKEAKNALSAVDTITEAAEAAITSIAGLGKAQLDTLKKVTKGVQVGAEAAGESISAMEKASVILTVISTALEIAMAIVNVIKQYTKSAQMQKAIDEQLERVDDLVFAQKQLQYQYSDKKGTNYYRAMAEAAQQYSSIVAASNTAVREARELYEYMLSRYGSDADKTKDAKKQYQDLLQEMQQYRQEQTDMYEDLMQSLTGTDLTSFSESLADALIEGFRSGTDQISDVWEDTLDDLMRQMMRQQLALAIADKFQDVFDYINTTTKNGDLTQAEIDSILAQFEAKTEEARALAQTYYELMSERGLLEDEDTEASRGFGQMTQDQADTLTARFTALQIEGANVASAAQQILSDMAGISDRITDIDLRMVNISDMLEINCTILRDQLDQLEAINENTALLAEMRTRLQAIEQNTSRL